MGDKSKIEWTEATWNPVVGCAKVSEGCRNCYAMRVAHRLAGMGQERYKGLTVRRSSGVEWNGKVRTVPEALEIPLRWKRPRRIFVNSMGDLFHPSVPEEFIARIFTVMALAKHHTFQILTKHPDLMLQWMKDHTSISGKMIGYIEQVNGKNKELISVEGIPLPLPNVWLGVSVEDQKSADERIPILLQVPAAVRWLSMEPLLGPVDLTPIAPPAYQLLSKYYEGNTFDPSGSQKPLERMTGYFPKINWIVVGGESGSKARPMHPDWVRSLRDQCTAVSVPFFFKQWGEWKPIHHTDDPDWCTDIEGDLAIMDAKGYRWEDEQFQPTIDVMHTCWELQKLGKKASGRILDGRTWDEMPKVKEN